MEEKEFKKLMSEVEDSVKKLKLAGLKGQSLHEHLRAIATSLHFKWVEKKEMKIGDIITKMQEHIKEHLVTKAEADEENAVHLILINYVMMYLTLNAIFLYEMRDIKEVGEQAKNFRVICKKKGIPKDVIEKVAAIMENGAKEWKNEFDAVRKMINSVWAKANDREGWALNAFSSMHKEGYFIRYQERKKFKDALRKASQNEASEKKLKKVQSKEDLIKQFTSWYDREKYIANDYKMVAKMLFNTWTHTTEQMGKILGMTIDATKIHELPKADADQLIALHNAIVESVNKKFLHGLRIEEKQLEAIYVDVQKEIQGVRKAA